MKLLFEFYQEISQKKKILSHNILKSVIIISLGARDYSIMLQFNYILFIYKSSGFEIQCRMVGSWQGKTPGLKKFHQFYKILLFWRKQSTRRSNVPYEIRTAKSGQNPIIINGTKRKHSVKILDKAKHVLSWCCKFFQWHFVMS